MHDFFVVERLLIERHDDGIGDDIVEEIGAGRTWITEITSLNGSRPIGKNTDPGLGRVAFKVNRNIDP